VTGLKPGDRVVVNPQAAPSGIVGCGGAHGDMAEYLLIENAAAGCSLAVFGAGWVRTIVAPALLVVLLELADPSLQGPGRHLPSPAQVAVIVAGAIPLLWRLRRPLLVTAAAVVADCALPMIGPHYSWVPGASMLALFTLAGRTERRTAWTTTMVAALCVTGASLLGSPGGLLSLTHVLPANFVIVVVAAGDSVRNRRAYLAQVEERAVQAERDREEDARRSVREERVRIARELHDVVAHHMTLVNAQVGVAHHLLRTDQDKAYQALAHVKETSRGALDELRATVSLLRDDNDPHADLQPAPSFSDLDDLLTSVRETGLDIRLSTSGPARRLSGATDLAAYRIVQEALTNVSKHGTGNRALLDLAYTSAALNITVTNQGQPAQRGPGTGHGIIGMRERADAASGTLAAGLGPDGTYRLHATLPLNAPEKGPS
jgi:signal transduction histidine kinase